eukprot:11021347-Alexandrium_andersonii.AAC.1
MRSLAASAAGAGSCNGGTASEQQATCDAESDHAHRPGGLGEALCMAAPEQRASVTAGSDHAHRPGFA